MSTPLQSTTIAAAADHEHWWKRLTSAAGLRGDAVIFSLQFLPADVPLKAQKTRLGYAKPWQVATKQLDFIWNNIPPRPYNRTKVYTLYRLGCYIWNIACF
jgi:hypothetical protein